MRFIALLLLCTTFAWAAPVPPTPKDGNLTQAWAKWRRTQVKDVHYELVFELERESESFTVRSVLLVNLKHTRAPLTLDLVADKLVSVVVNGKDVKPVVRPGSFDIPAKALALSNKIEIQHTSQFSKESNGFQRSVDPEDKSEYLFTDFEPSYAHKLFPCFDQPDIKATFQVITKGPAEWKYIHNEPVSSFTTAEGRTTTFFPTTPKLSTYLFFLGAGPFVEWTDEYKEVPLTIYARKTLAKYVDHQNIFATTKKGLAFFESYFGMPYPFKKYGQVFIPEFAWGGMENPGAVTLNERNVFRGPVPQLKRDDRDSLILHEMAHMWFGDLVTMEWWNDLWLNESFATYAASLAQDRALETKSTWLDFFNTKVWGYWQDELVTTHPIETPVPDVRTAKGNFDGITYAKGAAALKQLHFFVGDAAFKAGLRSYFKTYAFQNTRREDFIHEIAKAAQSPLSNWTQKWLQTAGPNRVKLELECKDDAIKKITVTQTASVSKTLSPHRTRLGLYELKDGKLVQFRTHDVVYDRARTDLNELTGTRCPAFVLPNQDDQDYALFSLDAHSLKNVRPALTTLPDSLSNLMVWNTLYQMVRDGELSAAEYFTYAVDGLKDAQETSLIENLIGGHSSVHTVYWQYLNKQERETVAPNLEAVLWQRILASEAGSSLQLSFFDFYLQMLQSPEAVERLAQLFVTNAPPKGIAFDQDRRWSILNALARNGYAQVAGLIDAEKAKDPTTMGERQAYGARAAIPDAAIKAPYWSDFFTKTDLPYTHFKQAGQQIHHPNHLELARATVDAYFKQVTAADWEKLDATTDLYFETIFPAQLCSPELLKRSELELTRAKRLTPLARRYWREANDELARCVRVRRPLAKSTPDA